MKKIKILLLLVLSGATLTSCSKSSEGASTASSSLLVGNWKFVGASSNGVYYPNPSQPCDDGTINFNSNGNFVSTKLNCNSAANSHSGTFTKTGVADQYQFVESTGTTIVTIVSTNNNTKFNMHTPDDAAASIDYATWQKQ